MSRYSLRRAVAAAAMCASVALLAACGSSSTESSLTPARLIAFGDAFADVGQAGSKYTVNDTDTNQWLQQVAARFERTITPSAAGGLGFGRASARITEKPDAAGNAATPTISEQIDGFLAGNTVATDDVVFVVGGVAELIAEAVAVESGTQTRDQMMERVRLAGVALADQTRKLVNAGAKHVVVVGAYDLSITPWGQADSTRFSLLHDASLRFNEAFLVSVVNMGENVLYVDAAYYFNLLAREPDSFNMDNSRAVVCTSVNAGAGIGIGAGQVDSSQCTPSTIIAGANYNRYMFADAVYTTPNVQRLFGDYAYDRIRNRW